MAETPARSKGPPLRKEELVAAYKRLLQTYLDRRPSGMRLKIAGAIGKNRSFVSQITNPAYPIPVPARHLETIFRICHFSPEERQSFLAAYGAAHPNPAKALRVVSTEDAVTRHIEIELPHTGDADLDRELEETVRQFVRQIVKLVRRE